AYIFVRIGHLLNDRPHRAGQYFDPLFAHVLLGIFAAPTPCRFHPATSPARSVTTTRPGEGIAPADQDVARATHVAWDEDGLTGGGKDRTQLFGSWAEGAGRPLAVDTEAADLPFHFVLFKFCNVVGDIVEEADLIGRRPKDVGKGDPHFVEDP